MKNSQGYYDLTAYRALKNIDLPTKNMNRNIVYICSPLRGNIPKNQRKACEYCRFVVAKGYTSLATHLLFPNFLNHNNKSEHKKAMRMSLELLSRSDEIWCFGDNLTEGMLIELEFAAKYNIAIKYFTDVYKSIKKDEAPHEQ